MNKVVRTVILSVLAFSFFVACKNYTADIDDYLSYWSTESSIADYTFDPLPQIDAEKAHCVPSKMAVTVTFTVRNPRNFDFKMPGAVGAPADIVTFPYIGNEPDQNAAIALQPGIDYEFTKISNTKLALTYTPVFLQKHEWGRGDITPTIILYTTDGRHFKQDIQFALKVNTPPPAITHYAVAKTKTNDSGKDAYYVLCLQIPNMDVSVPGGLLHKDIVGIEINGITYPLSVNEEQHTFIKPEDTAFLDITDVEKLEADEADIPSGWVLYFKTDVPVKEGSAKKGYTIKLIDVKGLTSPELKASTKPNKLQKEVVTVAKGETTGTGNGTASSPIIIGTGAEGAAVMISSPTPNTTVYCMLMEVGQVPTPEQTGSPSVTVALPLNGANEKRYKLEYYTDGEGFAATARQTSYYKIVLKHTVTFNLAGGNIEGNTNVITMTGIPGTSFTKPVDPVKEGYTFNGWNPALPAPLVFPAADTEYIAQWMKNGDTPYTIEHYKQNSNDDNYTIDPGATQSLKGETGAPISVAPKTYEGFTRDHQEPASPTIAADGKTVVKVYYKRNSVTVTFKLAGGNISSSTADVTREGKFGATFTAPADPTRDGYTFSGWNPALPAPLVFPAADTEYTAQWTKAGNTPYKIEHYKQNSDDNNYTLVSGDTQSLQGETGASIAVVTKNYEGFTWARQEPVSPTIAAGGNTVVRVYYNRKSVRLTFKLAGGNISSSTADVTREGKFGATFTAPADPTRDGYTFNDWNPALPAPLVFPAADTEYTAQWTANQYTVHFDGNENTGGFMSDQTFTYGTSQALQSNSFTKDGYTFKGWAYSSDAASPSYNDGQSVENLTVTNNVVVQLYAVWQINTYTVEFKVAGGQGGTLTGTYNSTPKTTSDSTEQQFKSVPYNSTITFTATPDSGYAVDSWTGAVPDPGDNKKASLTVRNNVTVIVKFKAVGGQSPAITTWEVLRKAVQDASDGDVIEIANDITYEWTSTESTIKVKENITIKSTASHPYTLNANGKGADGEAANAKIIGIFEVDDGKTLTLENVILTKTEKYAVYVGHNSSLTMKNVTITNCKTQYNAAGIYFNKGQNLTLENCIIEKCKGKGSSSSGGINIQEPKGTVSIKDTTIKNCEAKANGGGMYLNNVANCTLEKVKIQKCSAANGGGIYNSGGKLILKECSIGDDTPDSGNTAKKGGGVYLKNVVTLTMQNVTVKNNKALTQGGGIYLADGVLEIPVGNTIADNSITGTNQSAAGGGIYVEKGTLTLNGGIISRSSANANKGGGVYLKAGIFTMNSGKIENCSAKYGGGVSLAGTSTFTMTGGTITGCKAEAGGGQGGGIYTERDTTLTLRGADSSNPIVISNCTAKKDGGGMLIHTDNPVTVKNAHIEENSANSGGGVYLEQGTFTIAGSTRITPSTETTAGKNDVFLKGGMFIKISEALTETETVARITPENYADGVKVLEGASNDYTKFTVTPNSEGSWQVESNGTLKKQ